MIGFWAPYMASLSCRQLSARRGMPPAPKICLVLKVDQQDLAHLGASGLPRVDLGRLERERSECTVIFSLPPVALSTSLANWVRGSGCEN